VVATVTAPQVFVTGAEVGGGGLQSLTFKGSSAAGDEMAALFRCVSGCSGTGGTSAVDNTVWVYGTTNVTPAGFVFDATPTAPDDGKVGAARMNANRDVHVYPVKPDGTAAMTANGLEVSPTTVVSVQGYNREQALLNVTTATNLTLDVRGAGSIAFSIVVDTSCTCVVVFEATFDDSVWFRVPVVLQTDTATTTTSHGKIISSLTNVTTSNAYRGWFKGTGWKSVRVRTSSMSAGQVDFHLQASLASNGLHPTQIHCTETATFDTAAATTPVQLIAAVADELIYICSVEASSDGTTQLKLVDGTSSTCASSATISANHRLTAQTGWTNTAAPGGILYKATGLNRHVCVQTSGSVQVNGIVSYARF
jgi:hypothetical protein